MPDWAREVRKRLASVRVSPMREAEIVEELSQHLEDRWRDLIAGGAEPEAAARLVLAECKDTLAAQLASLRQARWEDPAPPSPGRWLAWHDLRQGVRALRSAPAYSAVALAVLTLSIGATTAIVSVVDAVVVRGLPFQDAGRLVAVGERNIKDSADGENLVAPQNFSDWREQQDVFTGLAAVGYASVSLKPENGQEPETLKAQAVTADFFPVLNAPPLLGRTFTAENERDGNARVVVISYSLWQRRFGGSPDVIGRYLPGQLMDLQILGVMPPGFAYPVGAVQPTEVWLPNVFRPEERIRAHEFSYRLQVIGRLKPNVTIEQAQARMDQITARLAAETPRWFEDRVAKVEFLHGYLMKSVRGWMLLLLGAVAFVLLIACVNLSNLTLVRVSTRSKEFAIRTALGASRWDLARALLIESLLLSLLGAVLGACFAWIAVELLRAAIPAEIPRAADIAVNLRVLTSAMAIAVATALIFSAMPMFHFSRRMNIAGPANKSNGTHQGLRGLLVVAEVALAVVLLVGSGLFLASFRHVANVDLGIDPKDVLTVRVRPLVSAANWKRAQEVNRPLLRTLLEKVSAIPGVEIASLVSGGVPLRGDLRTVDFGIPGRVLSRNEDLDFNEISADYFRAMRVPLLAGRFFNNTDQQGSEPVAIINAAAAKKYFPGENPIGKAIQFEGLRTVVGVVGSIRHDGPETDWRRQGFIPIDQSKTVAATLALRLNGEPAHVIPAVKSAIWSQFPAVPLPDIQTMEQFLRTLIAQRRFNMLLLGLFGLLGIVIALVGIYGVMAYAVTQRTREIGIRLALGALPATILRMILGRATAHLAAGLLIGLIAAWSLSGLVAAFLFQVRPTDISVYAGVGAVLVTTGLAAAFVPARRAARVDPVISLRLE